MTFAASLPFASETEAQHIAADLTRTALVVVDRCEEIITDFPPFPYTTATLLEDAALAFNWTVSQITRIAQTLFEQGLITYPRTDSIRVAEEALEAGKQVVVAFFGVEALGNFIGESFPQQDEAIAQLEAHEAIRPTLPERHPDNLREVDGDASRLYQLIWARFLASLMKPSRSRIITLTLEPEP